VEAKKSDGGAIKIIRDILRGGCDRVEGGVNQNDTSHFLSIFELNFTTKSYVFSKIIIVTSHQGGGPHQCHQMSHGEGGSKIGQKSVTYFLNGPRVLLIE